MKSKHLYEFDSYRLDAVERVLMRGGQPVTLPPKDLETLLVLVERAGHIVEKEELLEKVWPGVFVEEGNLARHIFNLRQVLGDGPDGRKYIDTIPKRGYRFVAAVREDAEPVVSHPAAPQTSEQAPTAVPLGQKRSLWLWLLALSVALGVALGATGLREKLFRKSDAATIRSLAVLPLENLSHDPEQEYFADGMTEALTTEFAQISALKVISHTSVVQYKGTRKSLPQIAQELGVDAVVEGAVERSGDKVEITVQLIHAPSDRHLWAKSYERDLRDILALQREVTHSITGEIQAKLTSPEEIRLGSARSIDSEAYEDYLRGRFSLEKGDMKKSIAYFQEAIQENPNYALAYAGLANSYISFGQPWAGDMSPKEVLPQAKAAATKALEIDDSLGEGHLALARIIQLYDWDWPAVEKEYRRALDLNPNDAMAHAWYGEYLHEMGRNEEAFVQMRQVMTLDPLNPGGANELGDTFYTARQYDQAIRAFRMALELEPDNVDAHVGLAWVYEQKKMYSEAIAELDKSVRLSNEDELPLASLGQVLGESGRTKHAAKLLEELKRRSEHHYISPCLIALVQIGLGERDKAIASLEQGYTEHDQWMLYLKVDPHLDDLRTDPRFKDLVRRVGP